MTHLADERQELSNFLSGSKRSPRVVEKEDQGSNRVQYKKSTFIDNYSQVCFITIVQIKL